MVSNCHTSSGEAFGWQFDYQSTGVYHRYILPLFENIVEIWNKFLEYLSRFALYCYEKSKSSVHFLSAQIKVSCFNVSAIKDLKIEFFSFKRVFKQEFHYHISCPTSTEILNLISQQPLIIKT